MLINDLNLFVSEDSKTKNRFTKKSPKAISQKIKGDTQ